MCLKETDITRTLLELCKDGDNAGLFWIRRKGRLAGQHRRKSLELIKLHCYARCYALVMRAVMHLLCMKTGVYTVRACIKLHHQHKTRGNLGTAFYLVLSTTLLSALRNSATSANRCAGWRA